jgi:hypothetical protein
MHNNRQFLKTVGTYRDLSQHAQSADGRYKVNDHGADSGAQANREALNDKGGLRCRAIQSSQCDRGLLKTLGMYRDPSQHAQSAEGRDEVNEHG